MVCDPPRASFFNTLLDNFDPSPFRPTWLANQVGQLLCSQRPKIHKTRQPPEFSEHIGLGVIEDGGELQNLRPYLVGDGTPLDADGIRRLLGEGGGDEVQGGSLQTFTSLTLLNLSSRPSLLHRISTFYFLQAPKLGIDEPGSRQINAFIRNPHAV